MQDKVTLFIALVKASVITTTGCFLIALLVLRLSIHMTVGEKEISGAIMAFVPGGIAALWLYRELKWRYGKHEAKIITVVFAIFTPVSLLVSVVCAQIPGGYAASLGRPVGLIGGIIGVVVMNSLLSFVPSILSLWATRHFGQIHRE